MGTILQEDKNEKNERTDRRGVAKKRMEAQKEKQKVVR